MTIPITEFSGLAPKIEPRNLLPQLSTTCVNCRFEKGNLTGIRGPTSTGDTVAELFGVESIYLYEGSTWLAFAGRANVVRSPIANDARQRVFYTEGDYPKVYSQGSEYRLGIPLTPLASTVTVTPVTPLAEGDVDAETLIYTFTYVDAWGQEGAPNGVTALVTREIDTDVNLSNIFGAPATTNTNFGVGSYVRLYRSNTGSEDTAFQYVDDIPMGQATYTDTTPNSDLEEVLPSADWIPPPNDDALLYPDGPLRGLVSLPNGVLAGYTGNTLAFSQPYFPHAWPFQYRLSVPEQIRGIAPLTQGALVVTDGRPYFLVGSSPSNYTLVDIDINQACVSEESLVSLGEMAIYASPDGLVISTGTDTRLVTEEILDKETWAAYNPTAIRAWGHERKYIADAGNNIFIFDPRGGLNALIKTDEYADAAYHDIETDELYVLKGSEIYTWETGAVKEFTWASKKFVMEQPRSYSAARVVTQGSVNLKLKKWVNGAGREYLDKDLGASRRIQRIPYEHVQEIQITLSGTGSVEYFLLAESMEMAARTIT